MSAAQTERQRTTSKDRKMPKDIAAKIQAWFPKGNEAEAIVANWSLYSTLSLGSASWPKIKREAQMVLDLSRETPADWHPAFVAVR
jgi:hypothetical protein